ncbi:carbohydrate porin [Pedosphaera parvula]|uniref:Carbohydrate-selective porin OprB n=1 Tax=Pedosphaera parvula (strain Ellin514) TaxID=320771 RepID=B9XRF7_PEDPL|nr:carbohydrate porin [Pedosphaera parvula]EEF57591.1 Carbohydrate-selective porin OprB [Pedosphaera parvula Ellin514]
MKIRGNWKRTRAVWLVALVAAPVVSAAENPSNGSTEPISPGFKSNAEASGQTNAEPKTEMWSWHAQNTYILQYHPGFPAKYSGPNSLRNVNEVDETGSLDLLVGRRLWPGAEFHVDGLMWQGFGFSGTRGVEGFPNGEAFRVGTKVPNVNISRLFIRQTIGLGGELENVTGDDLHLAGERDVSRVTLTVGKMSAKDIFDNNAYANDPRTQFMNWSLMANQAWDYPADSLGFMTGLAVELNQPSWTARYGFFQVPRTSNGVAQDQAYTKAWAMVTELEHRHTLNEHPGAIRLLGYLNQAHMGSYQETLNNPSLNENITLTREYRFKYGVGLNVEQELVKDIGVFMRLGWSDGQNEAWMFSDVDHAASLGLSVKGSFWSRPDDTLGLGGAINGITHVHQEFFAAGGLGILAGDGALTYGLEELMEIYYDFQIWKTVHGAGDYQFINHPAFNRDRGPVSVFSARLHFAF